MNRGPGLKRKLNLQLLSRISTVILFFSAFFFAYPTFFYIWLLSVLDCYYSSSVFLGVSATVHICGFAGGLILISSLSKNSRNLSRIMELVATGFALQGFVTQASLTLLLQEYALRPYHPVVPGSGGMFLYLLFMFLLVANLVLLAASLVLLTHRKRASMIGQFISMLALIWHLIQLPSLLITYGSWLNTTLYLTLIFATVNAMSIYYLQKARGTMAAMHA